MLRVIVVLLNPLIDGPTVTNRHTDVSDPNHIWSLIVNIPQDPVFAGDAFSAHGSKTRFSR